MKGHVLSPSSPAPEVPKQNLNEIVGSWEMPFSFYEISARDSLYLEARVKDASLSGAFFFVSCCASFPSSFLAI